MKETNPEEKDWRLYPRPEAIQKLFASFLADSVRGAESELSRQSRSSRPLRSSRLRTCR